MIKRKIDDGVTILPMRWSHSYKEPVSLFFHYQSEGVGIISLFVFSTKQRQAQRIGCGTYCSTVRAVPVISPAEESHTG